MFKGAIDGLKMSKSPKRKESNLELEHSPKEEFGMREIQFPANLRLGIFISYVCHDSQTLK